MLNVAKNLLILSTVAALLLAPQFFGAQAQAENFIMVWSSDSYVPPDYPGKALPSRGSNIKVTVMPVKKLAVDPDKLYYRWLLDDDIQGWAYGTGKSSFIFRATKWEGDSHNVECQIVDAQNNVIWKNFIDIKITKPQVILNQQDGGYAAGEIIRAASGQELKLQAVPLFFHIKNKSEAAFEWEIADQRVGDADTQPDVFNLKISKTSLKEPIQKSLKITISNIADEFEQAIGEFSLKIQ